MKEITIPRAWFERLQGLIKQIDVAKDPGQKNIAITFLLGYCSSVDTLLEIYK